ncbi:hypothetical protein H1R20_g3998, partial [Candolleomyces eurysporus]
MVYVSKPVVVAALIIAPAIAAPVSDIAGSEEQYTREYEDSQFEAREPLRLNLGKLKSVGRGAGKALDRVGTVATIASIFRSQPQGQQQPREFEDLGLEAREPGRGWELGKKAFLAGSAAAAFGTMIAPIFKRPKNPTYKRGFEDEDIFERDFDEDLFERDFEIDSDLLERYFDDEEFYGREFGELEERAINPGSLLRIGKALGRGVKYVVPAAGLAGFGLGVAAKLRSRDFDEGLEVYEREAGSALDELD